MKKLVIFLFMATICIIIGCHSLKKNHSTTSWDDFFNEVGFSINTISAIDIEKINMGMPMMEVLEVLGRGGIVGDAPFISVRYLSTDGGAYDILFFELQDVNTYGEVRDGVTGIYYSKDSKGYFLLPEAWKGKTREEVMPVPRP